MAERTAPANDGQARRARSRRVLLTGAAGALGVLAAETVGSSTPAMADTGQAVLQGTDNRTPTRRTAVITANELGVLADPNTSGNGSLGVYGTGQTAGVFGEGAAGSNGAAGVQAAGGGNGDGVIAWGNGYGTGVAASGGLNNGIGVSGSGRGSGDGVVGQSETGSGVHGVGTSGTGVLAENFNGGKALDVHGRAVFSHSGIATIAAGRSAVTVSGIALLSSSFVLATIQQYVSGVYLAGVTLVHSETLPRFTIHLNKAVKSKTKRGMVHRQLSRLRIEEWAPSGTGVGGRGDGCGPACAIAPMASPWPALTLPTCGRGARPAGGVPARLAVEGCRPPGR